MIKQDYLIQIIGEKKSFSLIMQRPAQEKENITETGRKIVTPWFPLPNDC